MKREFVRPATDLLRGERLWSREKAGLGVSFHGLKYRRAASPAVGVAMRHVIPPLVGVLKTVANSDEIRPVGSVLKYVGQNAGHREFDPEIHPGRQCVGGAIDCLVAHKPGKHAPEHHVRDGGGDYQVSDLEKDLSIDLLLSLGRKW